MIFVHSDNLTCPLASTIGIVVKIKAVCEYTAQKVQRMKSKDAVMTYRFIGKLHAARPIL